VWPEVGAALPAPYQGEVVAARRAGGAGRVWRIDLAGGRALALKLAAGAPLGSEARTLDWLGQRGAPVPGVLALDGAQEPARWLALEWAGDLTLDDALVEATPARRATLGRRLALAVAAVEAAFGPVSEGLRRQPEWGVRVAALREQAAPWAEAAPDALEWLLGGFGVGTRAGGAQRALGETVALALGGAPEVGSLDYNPRNVVLGRFGNRKGRLTLVDFPATGVDWPERRLVQYATGTGGTFRSALGPAGVRAYAAAVAPRRGVDPDLVVATVDAHEVLLLLAAAAGLRAVAEGAAHPERAKAWRDVAGRREALLALLRRPVAGGGPAAAVRAAVRAALRVAPG
jgi:hypothetical protein